MPASRIVPALFVFALAAPVAALAADPADAPAVSTAGAGADDPLDQWMKDAPPVEPARGDPGPLRAEMGPPDRKIHGEIEAGIGSDGYRSLSGVVTGPLGKNGTLTIAASTSRGRFPVYAGWPAWAGRCRGPDPLPDVADQVRCRAWLADHGEILP